MGFQNYAYILVLTAVFLISLFYSFNKNTGFVFNLKYLIPALLFSGAVFIILEMRFAERLVVIFNPEYLTGKSFKNLPVEEWLYFPVISFAGLTVYQFIKRKYYFEKQNIFIAVSIAVLIILATLAYTLKQQVYPFFIFFLTFIYLGYTVFRNRFKLHYATFYLSFFILLILFIAVEAFKLNLPVAEYDPAYTIGPRIFSIPVENFSALFLLHLINVTIYEYLSEQQIF